MYTPIHLKKLKLLDGRQILVDLVSSFLSRMFLIYQHIRIMRYDFYDFLNIQFLIFLQILTRNFKIIDEISQKKNSEKFQIPE